MENLRIATSYFEAQSNLVSWIPPQAGPIAFPRWKGVLSLEAFCQELVEQAGVMIFPATPMGYDQPHFRIGLGRKNFSVAIERLDDFIRSKQIPSHF